MMNWQKIVTVLINEIGITKLCELANCTQKNIERIQRGGQPTYDLGDRLVRMYDAMKDAGRVK